MSTPPVSAGIRLPWDRLPAHVQDGIEQRLGAPVVPARRALARKLHW